MLDGWKGVEAVQAGTNLKQLLEAEIASNFVLKDLFMSRLIPSIPAAHYAANSNKPTVAPTNKPPINWKFIAGVSAAAGVGLLSLMYFFLRQRNSQQQKQQQQQKQSSGRQSTHTPAVSLASSNSSSSAAVAELDDRRMYELITGTLESFEQGNVSEQTLQSVRAQVLRCLDSEYSKEVRAVAAQFLLAVQQYSISQAQDEAQFEKILLQQPADMDLAWRLLQVEAETPQDQAALDLVRLQVAQNAKDKELMTTVFDRMMTRLQPNLNSISQDELLVLFTTAPLLGRWKAVRALGDIVIKRQGSLDDFHHAPLDYQMLYKLAKTAIKENNSADTALNQLKWLQYEIVSQKLKLKDISCDDSKAVELLKEQFASSSDGSEEGWKPVDVTKQSRIVRCGAILQVASFSTVAMTLVGTMTDEKIIAKGFTDVQGADCVIRQTESYVLRNKSSTPEQEEVVELILSGSTKKVERVVAGQESRWLGTYGMAQEKADPTAPGQFAKVNAVFEMELTLKTLPSI
jgi:hypothetical protein